MKKRIVLGVLCCAGALSLLGGVAMAQQNAAVAALESPVQEAVSLDAVPFVVRVAPIPQPSAAFGCTEDTSDGTIWVGELFAGTLKQFQKDLTLLQTVSVPLMATGTTTGLTYDPVADTFWIMRIATGIFHEIDKTGIATGRSFATGIASIGPATIDPADPQNSIWAESISLDQVFEFQIPTGAILNSHANPDNAGSGAFGNGLSYDANDSFPPPGDLVISSGTISESRVRRLSTGNPDAIFPGPRAYAETFFDMAAVSTFINGIQSSNDGSVNPSEVIYLVDNAGDRIIEISETPVILQCGPGAINMGSAALTVVDDMESGQQPFWNVSSTGFGLNNWAILPSPRAHSPGNVWRVNDEATIADKYLDLTVDISPTETTLEFWHTFQMENSFDGGVLEISTNGGGSFADLGANILIGDYNGTISTAFGNPIGGRPAWTGGTLGTMTRVVVDLSAFGGQTGAIIRWRHGSDDSVASVGWEVDDIGFSDPNDPCTSGPRANALFVNRVVPSIINVDDMESGQQPFWAVSSTGFGLNDWAILASPRAHSPANVWRVNDEATIADKYLDLTADVPSVETTLEFWHTFQMENTFDGGVLEISTNGGGSFSDLGGSILEGGYNGTISTAFGNPIGGRPAWTGGTLGTMTRVRVDLSAFAGQTGAIIRWRHASDDSVASVGWEVDDIAFVSTDEFAGTGDGDLTITEFGQNDPISVTMIEAPANVGDSNPSNACVYIWVGEPDSGDIVMEPAQLGPMCFGHYAIRTKNPKIIINGIGRPADLGTTTGGFEPGIPDGAEFEIARRVNGPGHPVTVTLQGIIQDRCSQGNKPYSVTNGIILRIE